MEGVKEARIERPLCMEKTQVLPRDQADKMMGFHYTS